jgi:glycosyl transferase, family 25
MEKHIALVDLFDHIYIINLIERRDRRRELERELQRIAVDILAPKVRFFPATKPDAPGGFPSVGARGCFLSHLGVLDDAVERGFRRILILEDDLDFVADFNRRSPPVLGALAEREWAVFYGGYRARRQADRTGMPGLATLPASEGIETTHFIAFQGDSIAAVSRYLKAILARPPGDPQGGPMHVDGAYSWFRKDNPQLVTLLADPELGYQRPSRSDIYPARWYDRTPLISGAAGYARRLKSGLRQYRS